MSRNCVKLIDRVGYIELTNRVGVVVAKALVDEDDVERVLEFGRWHRSSQGYAASSAYDCETLAKQRVLMHRFLLNPPADKVVDHINHNKLDNRRDNLRVVSHSENMQNRRGADVDKANGIRNVYDAGNGKHYVRICGQNFGTFDTIEEAKAVALKMRPIVLPFSTSS